MKLSKGVCYIYVCYPIKDRDDKQEMYAVDFSEMESFTTIEKASAFCKEHYAKYMIAVEMCDKGLFDQLKKEGQ
jgi:hypothetical protein